MPFSAPVLTYRAKGLASNIQSKVLKVHNTLININITAISAPEMTYTPIFIPRSIFPNCADNFSSLRNYFLLSVQKFFVTNLVTCITNFVICVTNFLTCVTNFVTKTFLYDSKKYLLAKEKFQAGSKN